MFELSVTSVLSMFAASASGTSCFIEAIDGASPGLTQLETPASVHLDDGAPFATLGENDHGRGRVECEIDADCDDDADCTIDHCVDTLCVYEDICPDDGSFCTLDYCNVEAGRCEHIDLCPCGCEEGECLPCCDPPLVEAAGSRYIAITPLPMDLSWPVSFVITSPDWPCLSKYVGGFSECGDTGQRCQGNADCNQCDEIVGACLTDEDCKLCTDSQTRCYTDQDCPGGHTCSHQYSCLLSGNTCDLQPLGTIDVDADGLDDGIVATLVDDPADAASLTSQEWGASLRRCSILFEACTSDDDCDVGVCSVTGDVCDVPGQDCAMVCAIAQTECEVDVHCPPGDACNGVQACEPYETCEPGRVYLTGEDILPSELVIVDEDLVFVPTRYEVWADCGGLVGPVEITMPAWGDADQNRVVNFDDIQSAIMVFEGHWPARIPPRTVLAVDLVGIVPCMVEQIVSFGDISFTIFAFQDDQYNPDVLDRFDECDVPCS